MANESLHNWTYTTGDARLQAEYAAVLVSVEKNRNTGSIILTREWPDMDATAANTFAFDETDGLESVTVYSLPSADQQTYSSDPDFEGHRPEIIAQAGRGVTVRQTLTSPTQGDTTLHSLKSTWVEDDTLEHNVYYYFDNTAAQYTTAITKFAAPAAGLEVNVSRVSLNADGSIDFIIETVTESSSSHSANNLEVAADPVGSVGSYKSWKSSFGHKEMKIVKGATEAQFDWDIGDELMSSTKRNAVSFIKNPNGLFDYSAVKREIAPVSLLIDIKIDFHYKFFEISHNCVKFHNMFLNFIILVS